MKPQVIKFDKERPVFFGWSAIAEFEKLTGCPIGQMEERLADGKATDLIAFIYSGLVGGAKKTKKDIDFNQDDVEDWLDDIDDLDAIFKIYMECMPIAQQNSKVSKVAKKK